MLGVTMGELRKMKNSHLICFLNIIKSGHVTVFMKIWHFPGKQRSVQKTPFFSERKCSLSCTFLLAPEFRDLPLQSRTSVSSSKHPWLSVSLSVIRSKMTTTVQIVPWSQPSPSKNAAISVF